MEQILPTKPGQIVRIINAMPGEDPNVDYILGDDPEPYDDSKLLLIYSVTDLMRATRQGKKPFPSQVQKADLTVIANSLEEWVESWNDPDRHIQADNTGAKSAPSPF